MKHNIKRILSYVKENKWLALITIVCMLGEVILEMQMYFVNLVMSSASMTRIVEVLDEIPAIPENRESKLQLQDGSIKTLTLIQTEKAFSCT